MIRRIVVVAVAVAAWTSTASAQQTRPELLRAASTAYDDFAPDRAADLLKAAVNPLLGPTDTAWVRGVHLLAQILVERNQPDLAKAWARWAMRVAPEMKIDSVNFLAGVVSALREARTFTSARTTGDFVAKTSWRWPPRGNSETNGRVVIDAAAMPVPVNVRVVGSGLVPAGPGLSLPPGSYELEAGASGYLPARVTREVLPGVSTVLAFSLTSAALASDVIAENIRQHTFANTMALSVRRFGSAPSCAAAAFMSRDGLLLTSYQAIRGADGVSAASAGGNAAALRIAAYDVATDVAVLQSQVTRTDSIASASSIADGQSVWGLRFADCHTPSEVRVLVNQWTDRPRGDLRLSDAPTGAAVGSPLVDVQGRLTGLWTGGTGAVAAPRAVSLLDQARRNIAQGQLVAVGDVSRKENHAYGSVIIASDVTGATARVSPLESWQWASLQSSGAVPFAFAGPMGRYKVEVTGPGDLRREQEITIRPGAEQRLLVALRSVAVSAPVSPSTAPPKKKSKTKWIVAGVLGGGALAGLALAGGGSPPPPPPGPSKGSISISIPANQP